jgi:hypothetical protein
MSRLKYRGYTKLAAGIGLMVGMALLGAAPSYAVTLCSGTTGDAIEVCGLDVDSSTYDVTLL